MPRIDSRDIEDFLEKEIPYLAEKDFIFDYLATRIERDDRSRTYFGHLVKFVIDGLTLLDAANKLRRDPFEHIPDLAAYYSGATLFEDKDSSDRLTDSEYKDVKSLAETARDMVDAIEDFNEEMSRSGRGRGGRGGRDDDRRGSRYGREEESRGGRYSSSRREENRYSDRDDRRGGRDSGGRYSSSNRNSSGSGRYSGGRRGSPELRRTNEDDASAALLRRHESRLRQNEEEYEEPVRARPSRQDQEPTRTPDPRRVNSTRTFEQVEPEDLTKPSEWSRNQERKSSRSAAMPSGKGPISERDIIDRVYDLNDPDVIMAVPTSPKSKTGRIVGTDVYEIDEVRPEWFVSEKDGYRHLRYLPLTDEEKEEVRREIHKLPVINREYGTVRLHPQNNEIRTSLTKNRFDLDAAKNVRQSDVEKYNEVVASIQAENLNLPEDQQKELPEDVPATQVPVDQPIKLREAVKGFGMDHVKVLATQRAATTVEALGDKYRSHLRSIQFRAESYKALYVAPTVDAANAIVAGLNAFAISDIMKPTGIEELYNGLEKVGSAVPVPVISAIRRHVVQTINNVFKYEMGSNLTIETFEDVRTLGDDLIAARGKEFTALFGRALATKWINLQLVQVGSDVEGTDETIDDRTIYAVIRVEAMIVPMVAKDLSLSQAEEGKDNEVFIIDKESTPRLAKVASTLSLNAFDHLPVRQMLLLADNNIAEIRQDFIGNRAGVIQLITEQE